MQKTIEIISTHKGQVGVCVKGVHRNINFQDKGSVGVAIVDNDEAAVLLKLGKPHFWKDSVSIDTRYSTGTTEDISKKIKKRYQNGSLID